MCLLKRGRLIPTLLSLLLLLSAGTITAAAQEDDPTKSIVLEPRSNGFSLDSPVSVSAGPERNFLHGFQQVDDTVGILRPSSMSFTRTTQRSDLLIRYAPELEYYFEHEDLTAWNHSLTGLWSRDLTRKFTLSIGDSFISTDDPSRTLGNSLFLLPRGRYTSNTLAMNGDYQWNRDTSISFRIDNTVTTLGIPQFLRPGIFDQMGNSLSTTLTRRLDASREVAVRYSYLTLHLLGDDAATSPVIGPTFGTTDPAHEIKGTYTYAPRTDFELSLSGGVVITNTNSYTAGITARKRFGTFWFNAGYQRTITGQTGGTPSLTATSVGVGSTNALLGNVMYETATFGISGDWKRLGVELRANGSLAESSREVNPLNFFQARRFNDIKSGSLSSRVAFDVTSRIVAFTAFQYYGQNENELSLQALGRTRHTVGIEFRLNAEPRTPRPSRQNR